MQFLPEWVSAGLGEVSLRLLAPELTLTVVGLAVLMIDLVVPKGKKVWVAYLAIGGVVACVASLRFLPREAGAESILYGGLYIQDSFAFFFKFLFLIATFLTMLMSTRYLDEERSQHGEYYALICFATLGMMFMASGNDLLTIFVGLELMALSSYVLVGFLKSSERSNEAAMKYFIVGAFGSGFFLYGVTLFYGAAGTTRLPALAQGLEGKLDDPVGGAGADHAQRGAGLQGRRGAVSRLGAGCLRRCSHAHHGVHLRSLEGCGLRRGAAPAAHGFLRPQAGLEPTAMGAGGGLHDPGQRRGHRPAEHETAAGLQLHRACGLYVLVAVVAASRDNAWAVPGALVYLLAYTFMNVGAFALITMLRRREIVGEDIKDFAGLWKRNPFAAVMMSIFMLSLGGIPPTAGFVGKLLIFMAAIDANLGFLAVIMVVNTAISIYYYFRIVVSMWMEAPRDEVPYALSPDLWFTVVIAGAFTLLIGIYPAPWLDLAQRSILFFQ